MNKKLNGAAAPKHYESPALAVLNVNLEMGFAQSGVGEEKGNKVNDLYSWEGWEEVEM
ncbi:unknown [Bacteroides sp. CAG:709]|nr:unknown [Bacteroides sp. CAG:709]